MHPDFMKSMKNNGELEFLRAEALTGLTFSRIALGSHYQDKKDRNRINARKAYDCLLRFMPRDDATSEVLRGIKAKIAELKSLLQQLGEEV